MARAPKPVSSTDLLDLTYVSDPQLAPGGGAAAVVVTRVVNAKGGAPDKAQVEGSAAAEARAGKPKDSKYEPPRYRSRIELYDLSGRGKPKPTELTQGQYSDTTPRFSP
ncbi:MAG: hypothetical protein WDA15_09885, partial [Trueperaceae bacterium]